MTWVYWLLGVLVIAGAGFAAMGGFGELLDEDELAGDADHLPSRIPLALFGYRRDVVDRMLQQLRDDD